jgi:hypothetical protein
MGLKRKLDLCGSPSCAKLEYSATCDGMPELMTILRKWQLTLALPLLLLGLFAWPIFAQEKTGQTPDVENAPTRDGHDRPTTYPKIRFGKKAQPAESAEEPKVEDTKLKARVYLLDISDVMAETITVEGARETTRLEHMVAQMERSLDALARRKDPRLRFNIVTFGTVQDFAEGGELQSATEDNTKRAKEWLKKLEASGKSDIYTMLSECFEQEPESATMIVGGMPCAPEGVDEAELKKHKNAGEYVLEQLKLWRKDGKETTLDITGVGLSAEEKEYYKRLADAAGGTYLDA